MIRPLVLLSAVAAIARAADAPQPPEVDPGGAGRPPSDAVALFDGSELGEWVHRDGSPARWDVAGGEIVCKTGTGDILTKRKFGSAQIHIEFATPNQPEAKDQARGNSGVYVQDRYEVQILDSYRNPTYADGSAAAIYGQSAPLVNVSRPPEQWQTYDIIFHAPECRDGKPVKPAAMTVLHNGVLVQDHFELRGPTPGGDDRVCEPGSLRLQDHVHPDVEETTLRFRNIWVRPLER